MERAGRVLSRLKLPAGAVSPEDLALAGWPVAVGRRIAAHTRASSFAGGRLCVEVEDAVWKRQLSTLKSQILKRLSEVLGQSVVSEVQFVVVARRRQPQTATSPNSSADEAERIQDPVLRGIYRTQRGRRSA